jgi:hypothetical protein
VFSADESRLLLFDRAGKLLESGGRKGQGPGELSHPGPVAIGSGDSVFVYQRGGIDVFGPDLRYARNFAVKDVSVALLAVLTIGDLVFFSPSRPGQPFLHTVSRQGTRISSFGVPSLPLNAQDSCTGCRVRLIAQASAPDEFFAISPNEYRIERWSSKGNLRQQFPVTALWFPPGRVPSAPYGIRPNPSITGISRGDDGVLWIRGAVANERWKAPVTVTGYVGGVRVVSPAPASGDTPDVSGYTTVIDAIDSATGRLLATVRYDGELVHLLPSGHAYANGEDANGFATLKIWKLELRRPT